MTILPDVYQNRKRMLKSKKLAKFLLILFTLHILFLISSTSAVAKADDLIIDDSGEVTLILTGNSVLATTSDSTKATPVPAPATTQPTPVQKVVPLAPANSETKVKISPNISGDKKLKITIETTTKQPAAKTTPTTTTQPATPVSGTNQKTTTTNTPSTVPTSTPQNVQTTEKTVDNVILRGADKQPVLSIKPNQNQNDEVNIQQQNVNVSTNLPIQIDTKTHAISVQTANGTQQQVSILPDQAVKGADQKVSNSNLQTTKSDVTLKQERGQVVYTVNQEKKGKLLGTFDITLPSSVKISAQTGKTISVWQSPVSLLFGFLVR